MRVLRLAAPPTPPGPPIYASLHVLGDRWVACPTGRALHLHDLHAARPDLARPALAVPDCTQYAFTGDTLLARVGSSHVRRYLVRDARWTEAARFALPGSAEGRSGFALSPSGARLAAELGGAENRVVLLDASTGEALFSVPFALSSRATFAVLDGREVLFLSAPSYMGVLLVDAESGVVLQKFAPTSGWDFCHTHYALTADASRLVTFGCVWAAPYEARVYDATPWTRSAASATGFPLPRVWSQGEDLGCETVLPGLLTSSASPLAHCLSIVTVSDLPAEGTEEFRDLVDGLAPEAVALLREVRALPSPQGVLIRRVDLTDGRVTSTSVVPVAGVGETHVRGLPGLRAVVVGEVAQLLDVARGVVLDECPIDRPRGPFTSASTRDGAVVVIRAAAA